MTKIAILDDYIGVALDYGDWTALPAEAEITVFREAIAPDARTELGTVLCGTAAQPQGSAGEQLRGLPAPSEMAWALIFAGTKRAGIEYRVIRAGGWQTGFPSTLAGKTLGLLGAGRLGGAMVPVAKALGMDVVAWSQNLKQERCAELGVTRVSKDELVSRSDILGVFLVFSERSRNTLRADDLAAMKRGAVLVNVSRGPIVEEAALVEALRSGHLAGAGLDVYDREPLPADHPFRVLDNVVVTPHIGYVTEDLFRGAWAQMADDVVAYLAGAPIRVVTEAADCPPMAPQ